MMSTNKNARISEEFLTEATGRVFTARRDVGTLAAEARFSESDYGRSVNGLSIELPFDGGFITTELNGRQARTLYKLLDQTING